ncbi:MAG TPA: MltA domain-containing protein, partial [Acidobacteriota bacterium]
MKDRPKYLCILLLLLLSLSCEPKKKIYIAPKAPAVPTPHQTVMPPPEPPPPPAVWTVDNALVPAAVLPELRDDEPAQTLIDAIDLSLGKFAGLPGDSVLHFGADAVPVSRIVSSLGDFRSHLAELGLGDEFFRYVRENFIFYSSAAPQVVFTGYYEPLLRGSRRESPRYPYPLYGRPGDLVTVDLSQFYFSKDQPNLPQIKGRVDAGNRLVPYYTRDEIDFQSKLAGRHLEILWIDSLVDIFFLHIQGSGIVQLDDGSRIFVGYADQNGHPFHSIGRYMLDTQ